MPVICKKDTCRNPAVYGCCFGKPLFCSMHREPDSKNVRTLEPGLPTDSAVKGCTQCSSKNVLRRYKGYCTHCYIKTFPLDPLSLQTVYKSKETIIQKFIDSKFDGFVHKNGSSQIQINGFMLTVNYGVSYQEVSYQDIVIKFNPNKYENGKNPMLYTRLPELEKEISKQFERLVTP
jgi:hypothetical protein